VAVAVRVREVAVVRVREVAAMIMVLREIVKMQM
jgi:hypothetical protein